MPTFPDFDPYVSGNRLFLVRRPTIIEKDQKVYDPLDIGKSLLFTKPPHIGLCHAVMTREAINKAFGLE